MDPEGEREQFLQDDLDQNVGRVHKCIRQCRPTVIKLAVIVIVLIALGAAAVRMWLGVSLFRSCDSGNEVNTTNVSHENSHSLLPVVPASPHDMFGKLLFLIHVITSLLEAFPLAALLYRYYNSNTTSATIPRKMRLVYHTVVLLIGLAFSLVAVVVSVLEAVANVQFAHDCGKSTTRAVASAFLSFVYRIAGVIATSFMIYSTLLIRKRYLDIPVCYNEADPQAGETNYQDGEEKYRTIAKEANSIFVYQSWYFFTWILHIVLAISTFAVILRDVLVSGQSFHFSKNYTKVEHSFLILLAVFSFLSFGIPYVLVLSVNQWHKEAYERITEDTDSSLRKKEKLDFIPQLYTITIPTDSLQNFMPILFPTLSLIWAFTVKL